MSAANRFISGLHVSFLYGQIGMYFLSRFCQLTKGRCFCHEYRQVISRYKTFHFLLLYYQATRPPHTLQGFTFSFGSSARERFGRNRPRRLANRPAHLLILPLRLMNCLSRSECDLYLSAYRSMRDHLDRVRLSTLAGSAVQRMIAANGSSPSNGQILCNRSAL